MNYHVDVLEAKIYFGSGLVCSICSEFIENNGEDTEKQKNMSEAEQKQDCELKAFKRMSEKLKKAFPRLPILLLMDSLYASKSVWIFARKTNGIISSGSRDGSIPYIAKEYEAIPEKEQVGNAEYINEIDYKGHKVNLLKYREETVVKGEAKITTFQWITNLEITQKNALKIARTGRISAYTGNMALTGFTAPKLIWVQKHEPDNFARIKKVILPKDYAAYRLSGVHCMDVSDAFGMLLLDVKNKCWSKEMLEIIGLKEEQLAKLFESYQVVGTLKNEVADELGFSETVKVIAGGGDQAVAAVGTGTVGHGMCNVSLGTSGVVFIASKEYAKVEKNALHVFAHADGKYHFMGVMLSAAASNKWWLDDIIGTRDNMWWT